MSDRREYGAFMETTRYLDCLGSDYVLLRSATAAAALEDPVPSCPGWTVADLVTHVGHVYLHKVTVMRDGEWPDPWPPAELAAVAPLALLERGYQELTAEFAARPPSQAVGRISEPSAKVLFAGRTRMRGLLRTYRA